MSIMRLICISALLVILTFTGAACTRSPAGSQEGSQDTANELEIRPAPINEVEVYFMKSNPIQVGVHIKGGLPDGCTTFRDMVVRREGNTITIEVTVQRPGGVSCPAIYTYFEKDVNLGSNLTPGTTYTLKVNDHTTTFKMPL
jgi:hypothetical protein